MMIQHFTPDLADWPALVAHLQRTGDARWVLDAQGEPFDCVFYLGVVDRREVVGSITIKLQPMLIPATEWSGGAETPVCGPDGRELHETFVQTFSVEPAHRRLGAYQMRSWSSLDRPENYALKLRLGFAVYPAIFVAGNGQEISGVYFVKTVES